MNHNGNGIVDRKQKKERRKEESRKVSNYNEIKFAPKLHSENIFYLS